MTSAAGLPLATQGFTAGVATDNSRCRLQLATTSFTRIAVGNQAFAAYVIAGKQSFAARVAMGNQGYSARVTAGTQGFVIKGCYRRPCSLYVPLSFQGVPYCSRSNHLGDSPTKVMLDLYVLFLLSR